MFSKYLKYLIEKLQFIKVVIARFFIVILRKRRGIELLYLNYDKEHLFDNSYIVINYSFNNALYFRFGDNVTLEKQIKILNLKNCNKEIDFVVYGFFSSKHYILTFEPQLVLENSSFKTFFSNLNLKLTEKNIPKLIHSKVNCKIKTPFIFTQKINIKQPKIKILNTTFNQKEFI